MNKKPADMATEHAVARIGVEHPNGYIFGSGAFNNLQGLCVPLRRFEDVRMPDYGELHETPIGYAFDFSVREGVVFCKILCFSAMPTGFPLLLHFSDVDNEQAPWVVENARIRAVYFRPEDPWNFGGVARG